MFAIAASALFFVIGAVAFVALMTDNRFSAYVTRLYVSNKRGAGAKYLAILMGTMTALCGGLLLTVISITMVAGA